MNNATFSACADRVATIVTDHVLAAAEAYKALRQIEEALASLPTLDYWDRKKLAEVAASAIPGEMTVAEARSGVEVARAAILEGGRRRVAGQVLAALVEIKTHHAPMGDDRFGIHIDAAHLTM